MFRDRPASGFTSINEVQRSDLPKATSDQDLVNGQRTRYSSNEDALRHLIVDLTGQNANLRVDLEMAVKEGMKYREILKEWAALEQQKILDENMRKKVCLKLSPIDDLQRPSDCVPEQHDISLLFETTAEIQTLLENTMRHCTVKNRSIAYAESLHHRSTDAGQREAQFATFKREEQKLKMELGQTVKQHFERTQQMQTEIQNREVKITALNDTVAQLTKKLDAGEAELKKRDACISELINSHANQLNCLKKEIQTRDETVDSLQKEALRFSTEQAMASIAHSEMAKEAEIRLEQISVLKDTVQSLMVRHDELLKEGAERAQRLQTEIESRDMGIAALNATVVQLSRDANGLRGEVEARDESLVAAEARHAGDLDRHARDLEIKNAAIGMLMDETARAVADKDASVTAYAALAEELRARSEQVAALQDTARGLAAENDSLSRSRLAKAQKMRTEVQSRDLRIVALNEAVVQHVRDADGLRTEVKRRGELLAEVEARRAKEFEEAREKARERDAAISALSDEIAQLTTERANAADAYSQVLRELQACGEQVSALEEAVRALKAERNEMSQAALERTRQKQTEIQSRDMRIMALSETAVQLTRDADTLRTTLQKREEGASEVAARHASELGRLDRDLEDKKTALNALRGANQRLTAELAASVAAAEALRAREESTSGANSARIKELLDELQSRDAHILALQDTLLSQGSKLELINAEKIDQAMRDLQSTYEAEVAGKAEENRVLWSTVAEREADLLRIREQNQLLSSQVANFQAADKSELSRIMGENQSLSSEVSELRAAARLLEGDSSRIAMERERLWQDWVLAKETAVIAQQEAADKQKEVEALRVSEQTCVEAAANAERMQNCAEQVLFVVRKEAAEAVESVKNLYRTQLGLVNMKIDSLEENLLEFQGHIDRCSVLSKKEMEVMQTKWNKIVQCKDSEIFDLQSEVCGINLLLQSKEAAMTHLRLEVNRLADELEMVSRHNSQYLKVKEIILEELNGLKSSNMQSVNQLENILNDVDRYIEKFKEEDYQRHQKHSFCDAKYTHKLVQSKSMDEIRESLECGEMQHTVLANVLDSHCNEKQLAEFLAGLKECSSLGGVIESIDSEKIAFSFSFLALCDRNIIIGFLPEGMQNLARSAETFSSLSPSDRAKFMLQATKTDLANLVKWLGAQDMGSACNYLALSDLEDFLRLLPAKGGKRVQTIINMQDCARLASLNHCTPEEKANIITMLTRASALKFMYEMQRCELVRVFPLMLHTDRIEIELALEVSDAICDGNYETFETVKSEPCKFAMWMRPKTIAKIAQTKIEDGLLILEQLSPDVIAMVIEELVPSYSAQVLCCLSKHVCKLALPLISKKLLSRILSTVTEEQMDVLICRFPKQSQHTIRAALSLSTMSSGDRCSTLAGLNTKGLEDTMQWLDPERVGSFLSEMPQQDMQRLLTSLTPTLRNNLFNEMDALQRSKCLCLLSPAHRTTVLRTFTPEQILATLEVMSSKDHNMMLASMPTDERKYFLRANELNRLSADERHLALARMRIRDCTGLLQWIQPSFAAEYLRTIPLQKKLSLFHANVSCCWDDCKDPWSADFIATLFVTMTQQDSFPIIAQMRPSKLAKVFDHLDRNECKVLVSCMSPGDKALLIEGLSLQIEDLIQRNNDTVDILNFHPYSVVRRKVKQENDSFHPPSALNR